MSSLGVRCVEWCKCVWGVRWTRLMSVGGAGGGYKERSGALAAASSQDILMKSIRGSKETSDILDYVSKHHSIMNQSHILQAFRVIFSIQKSDGTSMSNGEVARSRDFQTLCNVLKSNVRSLETGETLDVLKTLSYLGVPASSKLVSILLNLLSQRINELSLQQIVFLDFLIKDFKATPIVNALKLALPVVFQANVNLKLDRDNVKQAVDFLHFATRKKLPMETVDSLVDVIMRLRNDLDLDCAMSVVRSICDLKSADESYRPLLHHSLDVVLDNINKCSFGELDILMSKCVSKYSRDHYYFYHEEFFSRVTRFLVHNNCSFEEGVWMLKKLNRVGHVEHCLLDYLCEKAVTELDRSDISKLKHFRSISLITLVRGLSTADYKPPNWSTLEPVIVGCTQDLCTEEKDIAWISFLRDLCTLGTWPLSIIERMLQEDLLTEYMQVNTTVLDHLQVLYIYQEIVTLCPEQFSLQLPPQVFQTLVDLNGKNVTQYPLLNFLKKGLGGDSFVASGVYTKLGHFLHHVIVMRKGGYPVPLNLHNEKNSNMFVDDLKRQEDHQLVAVMLIPPSFYCSNVEILKGSLRQHLNSISALGITVVPISSVRWDDLLEHEKIPYLMREINEKCDLKSTETANC